MPQIVEQTIEVEVRGLLEHHKRFKMNAEDLDTWYKIEQSVIDATDFIRLHFKLSAFPPPAPSTFGYTREHKSEHIARKMITLSRDWFGVWMGFFSYLIFEVELREKKSESPLPTWYRFLLDRGFSDTWLSGISASTICSFGEHNPRCGTVFQWTVTDVTRPPLESFICRSIPLWFPWTKKEEETIMHKPSFKYLWPPAELLDRALSFVFNAKINLPLAALVVKRFYNVKEINHEALKLLRLDEATSRVAQRVITKFLVGNDELPDGEQGALNTLKDLLAAKDEIVRQQAEKAASFPLQGMLTKDVNYDRLCHDWKDFFEARSRREKELEAVKSDRDRQRRVAWTANPPIANTTMYEWKKICTSGGKTVYVRVQVDKKKNRLVHRSYGEEKCRYNAFLNEWDFFGEFVGTGTSTYTGFNFDSDSDSDDGSLDHTGVDTISRDISLSPAFCGDPSPASSGDPSPRRAISPNVDMEEIEKTNDVDEPVFHSTDMLATLCMAYGYVVTMGVPAISGNSDELIAWKNVSSTLGFVSPSFCDEIMDKEKDGIRLFITRLLKDYKNMPTDRDDLSQRNFITISTLFHWPHVTRVSDTLFVFHTPASSACDWSLGVESASVALYVCRLILSNPAAHTILTVAHHLLQHCIPFRTLVSYRSSSADRVLSKGYTPTSFRAEKYRFTELDFESSMIHRKSVLQSPGGRAAMLHGGILSRIAQEFLSIDGVLNGPSAEVSVHHAGFVTPSEHHGYSYWDDNLTEDEIAIICGTYSMYTGKCCIDHSRIVLLMLSTGFGSQTTILSWFPPPSLWDSKDCGYRWLGWMEKDERLFREIMSDIRSGIAQPLSKQHWRRRLHGHVNNRVVTTNNELRSKQYLDMQCPTPSYSS